MLLIICSQPELRAALRKRAAHYCIVQADRDRLISRTISAVCDDPGLIETTSIQDALFKVMHQLSQPTSGRSDLPTSDVLLEA